jgi:hypothetical protein
MATRNVLVGRNLAIWADGYDISGNGNEVKIKRDAAKIDATVFGDHFSYDLAGIQKASLEFKGFYAAGYGFLDQIVNQRFGQTNDVYTCTLPAGYVNNGPAIMMPSVVTKYDVDVKLKGAVDIDSEFDARGFLDQGFMLTNPLSVLTATGTGAIGNGLLDNTTNGGATTGGWTAQIHVSSVSGTTPSLAMKLQGSPDGTTWTDLPGGAFNAITAANQAQRLVAVNGTATPSQIRTNWTISGTTPSFTAMVAFCRSVVYS